MKNTSKVIVAIVVIVTCILFGVTAGVVVYQQLFAEQSQPEQIDPTPSVTPSADDEMQEPVVEEEPEVSEAEAIAAIREDYTDDFAAFRDRALSHEFSYNPELNIEYDIDDNLGNIWMMDPQAFEIACNVTRQYCAAKGLDYSSFTADMGSCVDEDFVGDNIVTVYNDDVKLVIAFAYTYEENLGYIKEVIEN